MREPNVRPHAVEGNRAGEIEFEHLQTLLYTQSYDAKEKPGSLPSCTPAIAYERKPSEEGSSQANCPAEMGLCLVREAEALFSRDELRASTDLRVKVEEDDVAELEREKRAMKVFFGMIALGSLKMEFMEESGGGSLLRKSMSDSPARFGGPLGKANSSSSSSSWL
jgi:hypothetical protein